ncbi:cardiolipin synthase ClsB [Massilia pseudoviolaceinigra]|uniref:cardiolipin synthase ClsB n=1 Tax=Massilia pseudoviolaceinigra TaxID=3057165 RepID=UPI00279687BD|nr:cardiolipin synthase ClsB [Massilia sp. CCM 9206]MDQ1920031.1 cardiolipin synthase ClsB [Massilia sp. CCM 9206]
MRPVHYTAHNDIALLETGLEFFPALIAAIDGAQYDIYFETYIFADDATGRSVADALCRAGQRGVKVRVVTDWWGTGHAQSTRLGIAFAAANVRFRAFNAWFKRGVTRTHRKIVVVDRAVAFVGGINVNDDWFCDYDPGKRLPAPRWDFAVQVRGPLVAAIHHEMQTQWARVGHLGLMKRIGLFREMRKDQSLEGDKPMQAAFVVRDSLRNRHTIQRAYLHAIGHAKKSVLLVNPYFAPGHKFRKALAIAAERGVEVKLLIGVGEIKLQDMVARSFYPKLLDSGVEVYEYRKTQLHAKVAVVDDDWSTVGSSNCDGLSLFLNQEANVVVKDEEFARTMREHIRRGIADGVMICREDFEHVGWVRRSGYEVAYFFYKMAMRIFAIGYA